MATVMTMNWPEMTPERYEEARGIVNWETDPPDGLRFHTAWKAKDGFRVLDIWDSAEAFQDFATSRLMPGLAGFGLNTQPMVEFAELVGVFAPDAEILSE